MEERLRELVGRLRGLYAELEGLGERQRGMVEAGDVDGLLGLLSSRARVIGQIERGSVEVGMVLEALGGGAGVEGARAELAELASVARRVAERDRGDSAVLARRRDAVADELASAAHGRGAAAAYGGGARGPRFQDRSA
jgi:hypothetical protein